MVPQTKSVISSVSVGTLTVSITLTLSIPRITKMRIVRITRRAFPEMPEYAYGLFAVIVNGEITEIRISRKG
jgi:hypothetical protein